MQQARSTGNRYTDEVKDFARSIYKQSPETNTYEKVGIVVSEKFGFPKAVGKSTIGDWIKNGAYSIKAHERTKQYENTTFEGFLRDKVDRFKNPRPKTDYESKATFPDFYSDLRIRLKDWKKEGTMQKTFTTKELINYWNKNNIYKFDFNNNGIATTIKGNCNICGEYFEYGGRNDSQSEWELDHIVPVSISRDCSMHNAAIVHRNCNQLKSDLKMEELVELANKIAKYNG